MEEFLKQLPQQFLIQIGITFTLIVFMFLIRKAARKFVKAHIKQFDLEISRQYLINKLINLFLMLTSLTLLAIIWDVTFSGLAIYFSSFFAVAGVALFAQWSILSNITASVILFFNYPFKMGSKITILDSTNTVTGVITDITLFTIHLKTEDNQEITYPNNLALQKAIQIVKK